MVEPVVNYIAWLKFETANSSGTFVQPWQSGQRHTFTVYPIDEQYMIPTVFSWAYDHVDDGQSSDLAWYQAIADKLNVQVNNIFTDPTNTYPQAFRFSVISNVNGNFLQVENLLPVAQCFGLAVTTFISGVGDGGECRVTQSLNPDVTHAPQLNTTLAVGDHQAHCIKLDAKPDVTVSDLTTMAATGNSIVMNDDGVGVLSATFNVKINGVLTVVPCNGDGSGSRGDGGHGCADDLLTHFFETVPGISVTGNFWNGITLTNTTPDLMTIEVWTDNTGWIVYLSSYSGQAFSTTADNKPNTQGFWVCLAAAH